MEITIKAWVLPLIITLIAFAYFYFKKTPDHDYGFGALFNLFITIVITLVSWLIYFIIY